MFGARGKRDALVTGEQRLVRVTGREGGEDGSFTKIKPQPRVAREALDDIQRLADCIQRGRGDREIVRVCVRGVRRAALQLLREVGEQHVVANGKEQRGEGAALLHSAQDVDAKGAREDGGDLNLVEEAGDHIAEPKWHAQFT